MAKDSSSLNLLSPIRFKVLWLTAPVRKNRKAHQKQDSPWETPPLVGAVHHSCRAEAQETGRVHTQLLKHLLSEPSARKIISLDSSVPKVISLDSVSQLPREGGELGQPWELSKSSGIETFWEDGEETRGGSAGRRSLLLEAPPTTLSSHLQTELGFRACPLPTSGGMAFCFLISNP